MVRAPLAYADWPLARAHYSQKSQYLAHVECCAATSMTLRYSGVWRTVFEECLPFNDVAIQTQEEHVSKNARDATTQRAIACACVSS